MWVLIFIIYLIVDTILIFSIYLIVDTIYLLIVSRYYLMLEVLNKQLGFSSDWYIVSV